MKTSFIIGSLSLLFFKLTFFPRLDLLAWVFIAVVIDLLTGVVKAFIKKQAVTSQGFRQTAVKALQYSGLIIAGIIIGNSFEKNTDLVRWVNDGMLLFLLYVEVYSIFENLRDMNPESKVSKMIFSPALTILTLGMQRLSLNKLTESSKEKQPPNTGGVASICLLGFVSVLALSSCRVIKPQTDYRLTQKDTTIINYKKVDIQVPGATVTNNINLDSFAHVIANRFIAAGNSNVNKDSLINALQASFKAGLKTDTVRVIDSQNKAELKYWVDQYGKLQMSCTSKDQMVNAMLAEVTKLRATFESSKKTEIVYKMPWWGWLLCGASILIMLLFIVSLILDYKRKK